MSHSEQLLLLYSSYVRLVENTINDPAADVVALADCIARRNDLYDEIIEIMEMSE